MPAIAVVILNALPTVVTGVEHLIAYIASVRQAAQQSGEWTAEHENQFLASLSAHGLDPDYQP